MKKVYFGFALADSMFENAESIDRHVLSIEQVKSYVANGVESCCNPSHAATITAMRERFGLDVVIPETPPKVVLHPQDCVIVMGVRGLPRLTDRREYTADEIAAAQFAFTLYRVAY